MVLGCNETAPSRRVDAGLILAPVTVSMEWGREAGIRTGMVSKQVWYQNRYGIRTVVSEQVWYQNRYGIRIGMVSEQVWYQNRYVSEQVWYQNSGIRTGMVSE